MENNEVSQFESLGATLTNESISFLKEAGKWAYFLGILGFVFVGFMVIGAFSMGTVMSSLGSLGGNAYSGVSGGMITVLYLIFAAIYFFPVYYLYNFGKKVKEAFLNNDTVVLTESFKNLKSHYKFVGILSAIILGFYLLVLLIALLGGLGAAAFAS